MIIDLRKLSFHRSRGDEAGSDISTIYSCDQDGRNYTIGKREHGYGGNLYIPGKAGHVVIRDGKVVREDYVGLTKDDRGREQFSWDAKLTETLDISPWVIWALTRSSGWDNIILTNERSESSYGQPVVFENGKISDILTALINNLPYNF